MKLQVWTLAAAIALAPLGALAQWTYAKVPDEMRKSTSIRARLVSQNSHQLTFPHQGGSTLSIIVWKHPDQGGVTDLHDLGLFLNKGQLMCSTVDGCSISVRVGDDEIESYDAEGTDDSGLIWVSSKDVTRFLTSMNAGKRMIIEVPIFRHGDRQFRFSLAPLRWPK